MASLVGKKRIPKPAERFSIAPVEKKEKKVLVIEQGKGVALGEIAAIQSEIAKRKMNDKTLLALHRLVYGVGYGQRHVKAELCKFSGLVYGAELNRAKIDQRLANKTVTLLRDICSILCLERGGASIDIAKRIADFLEKPVDAEAKKKPATKKRAAPAAAEKKAPAKKTAKKAAAPAKKAPAKKTAAKKAAAPKKKGGKKAKEGPKKALSAYMFFMMDKRPEVVKKNPKLSVTEVAKHIGTMWKACKDKTPYEKKAAEDKKRFEKEKAAMSA